MFAIALKGEALYGCGVRSSEKAQLYHQLESSLGSGLPLSRILEVVGRGRGRKAAVARALAAAPDEAALHDLWVRTLGTLDGAVMTAGMISGRMQEAAAYLEKHFSAAAETKRKIAARLAYPLVVAHLGIILLAIPAAVMAGGWPVFLHRVLWGLAVLYGILAVLFLTGGLVRWLVAHSAAGDWILRQVPVLGGWIRLVCSERFATTLGLAAGSGITYGQGLRLAAEASRSAGLRGVIAPVMEEVREGGALAESLDRRNQLSPEIIEAIRIGDEAGRMPHELSRVAEALRARVFRRLEILAEWFPRLLYFGVAGYVAYGIIRTAQGIYGSYQSVLDSM